MEIEISVKNVPKVDNQALEQIIKKHKEELKKEIMNMCLAE